MNAQGLNHVHTVQQIFYFLAVSSVCWKRVQSYSESSNVFLFHQFFITSAQWDKDLFCKMSQQMVVQTAVCWHSKWTMYTLGKKLNGYLYYNINKPCLSRGFEPCTYNRFKIVGSMQKWTIIYSFSEGFSTQSQNDKQNPNIYSNVTVTYLCHQPRHKQSVST